MRWTNLRVTLCWHFESKMHAAKECCQGNFGQPAGFPDPLQDSKNLWCYVSDMEKAMAPHSSILAWKIPWTEGPGGLQSVGLLGVGHDWATSLSLFTFMRWRRKWQPTPGSCLENPRDGGAWWAAVYGVA